MSWSYPLRERDLSFMFFTTQEAREWHETHMYSRVYSNTLTPYYFPAEYVSKARHYKWWKEGFRIKDFNDYLPINGIHPEVRYTTVRPADWPNTRIPQIKDDWGIPYSILLKYNKHLRVWEPDTLKDVSLGVDYKFREFWTKEAGKSEKGKSAKLDSILPFE